jgi:hypothetical protein
VFPTEKGSVFTNRPSAIKIACQIIYPNPSGILFEDMEGIMIVKINGCALLPMYKLGRT